jgi:diguanylate cyclase (GGDEF)-like protein/PAS domain S-box-containing protein
MPNINASNSGKPALRFSPLIWVAVLTALLLLGWLLPRGKLFALDQDYLALHMVLEFASMAVSVMVFALAWNLRFESGSNHRIMLGVGFLGICAIDLAHTLSFAGMPDFVTPSSVEKAINFWLAARWMAAMVLLAVAVVPAATWTVRQCLSLLAVTTAVVTAILFIGLTQADRLPRTFIQGSGLTAFKIGVEYLCVALYGLAAVLIFRRSLKSGERDWQWLATAAWVQGLAEMYFTLYADVSDVFNLLGHVYKTIAYFLVYRAVFVEGVRAPLRALQFERSRLATVLSTIPDLIWLKDAQGVYLSCNQAFERFFGETEEQIVGRSDFDFVDAPIAQSFLEHDQLAMQAGKPLTNEEWLVFKTNGYRGLFETTKAPMVDARGTVVGVLGISRDITERERNREKLMTSASVFTHAREGIMITDAQGTITDVNAAFTRITGYERDEVLGKNPRILSSGRQGKDYYSTMWSALTTNGHWTSEVWNRRKNGEVFAELQTISAVRDANGKIEQYVSLFSDISAFKEHEYKLEHIAHYDPLTNLPNRVLLADRLHQGMVQRRGQQLAVAFLDLDGFKAINDAYGHEAGDHLLVELSKHMKHELREGDTLARLGGDEFVAVLIGLSEASSSVPLLNRLLSAASKSIPWGDKELKVSASLGVTFYPQSEEVDGEQLLRQADQAMYQAKLAGKNRFHVFDDAQDRNMRGHHESMEHIRRAIAREEFVLYYQPKVNMRTGKVIGSEALIRWRHPERGLLAPSMFLPVIENHALAIDLGRWVLEAAIKQVAIWLEAGLDLPVSVNVSADQLQQADFLEQLQIILRRHPKVPPCYLELEVLETSALQDFEGVSQVIADCAAIGVEFALDDFGTGYSSLTYLKRLPVSMLKIDQSFVRDMLDDADDLAILEGVIGLAKAFHRTVIAEGVESIAHGTRLLELGCDLAQGYGIARPMPANEFPAWVASWQPDSAWQKYNEGDKDNDG